MAMFDPAYPGEIIAEILEDQGVSLRQFAVAMDLLPSKKNRRPTGFFIFR